jgi:formylglycine-generating enzyme required for sulfatase activity
MASTVAQAPAAAAGQAYRETIANTVVTFDLVLVPGGTITVGGKSMDVKPFYIGKTEITWDQYDVFALGLDQPKAGSGADAIARPSQPYSAPDYGWGHAGYPAISIARPAAEAFAAWLSKKTGKTYRLPTETQWLMAAAMAVGKDPLTPQRIDAMSWNAGNASARTHASATKAADALGLFDLFGNAAEWVSAGDAYVTRGGSFRDAADKMGPNARAVQDDSWNERDPQLPKSRWWLSDAPFVGFRVVRNAE